ncbi:hypothetical protein SAMN06269185_1887 [Natronoarchaeum philippinense]|uniref:TrbC/VIRB2 family protein n=1 Tax=Natronoarchaeum philippinense TaxID=558529 RepID=A0A285NTD6_NATPI|nr:hypothetical protein [Natronoarchaeum philippinense]SNZ12719.1 hypothetical protein SAMN06269185_1887 [Natronoarchaeum philippinense]
MSGVVGVLTYSAPALAHASHTAESADTGGQASQLPIVAIVIGAILIGTSIYMDSVSDLSRRTADAGVFIGIAIAAVGATAFFWGHGI